MAVIFRTLPVAGLLDEVEVETLIRLVLDNIAAGYEQDIRELCPTLSDSSIESALRKLVVAGELKKEGRGKNTCYFRLN